MTETFYKLGELLFKKLNIKTKKVINNKDVQESRDFSAIINDKIE